MAISQINNVLVKHSKVLFGIFTFVIIIAFVCFFTPGMDIGIFAGGALGRSSTIATVFGEKVTLGEALDSSRSVDIAASAFNGVRPGMLNISRDPDISLPAARIIAKKIGILITRDEIGACIRKFPTFQEKGRFSAEKFLKYEKDALLPEGLNAASLENAVGDLMTMQAVFGSTPLGAQVFDLPRLNSIEPFVTPLEIADYQNFMLEKFTVRELVFEYASLKKNIHPSDKELRAWHAANKKSFMTLPQYRAEVIRFEIPSVPRDAAKKFYDANKKNYTKGGKIQPFAEVSREIGAMLKEQAVRSAAEKAGKFRDALSISVSASGKVGSKSAYLAAFRTMAGQQRLPVLKTGYFNRDSKEIAGIGKEKALAQGVHALAETGRTPVSRSITGDKACYIAAIVAEKPSMEEPYASCAAKVREAYLNRKSRELAKQTAAKFLTEIRKSANPAADIAKLAAGRAKMTVMKPAGRDELTAPIADLPEKSFTKAFEMNDGVYVFFLDKRTLPSEKECAANKKQMEMLFRSYVSMSIRGSFMEWLNSNIMLSPEYAKQFSSRK